MAQGMNPQKMLKQMQKMQEDMARVQTELQQESVTATAGGGAVTARVSGGLELLEITIDPSAVDPEDVELLQDVIVAAVNEAMRVGPAAGPGPAGHGRGRPVGPGAPRPVGRDPAGRPCSRPRSSGWSPSSRASPGSGRAARSGWPST